MTAKWSRFRLYCKGSRSLFEWLFAARTGHDNKPGRYASLHSKGSYCIGSGHWGNVHACASASETKRTLEFPVVGGAISWKSTWLNNKWHRICQARSHLNSVLTLLYSKTQPIWNMDVKSMWPERCEMVFMLTTSLSLKHIFMTPGCLRFKSAPY